jgi:hypothetical protein
MDWSELIHLGDVPLTIAAAAAIAYWLFASRAWPAALWWCTLFAAGLALVAASKVAFLVWGAPTAALPFRALSGHAMGATAIATVMCRLATPIGAARWRRYASILAGLMLGAAMVLMLVVHEDHSVAEAVAGWMVGALVSLGMIRFALPPAAETSDRRVRCTDQASLGLQCSVLVFVSTVFLLQKMPFGYLMYRAARMVARHAGSLTLPVH